MELLVVIGTIGILAALLIPTLSGAKAAAKSAGCQSNLRQICLALSLYVDDFEKYPLYDSNNSTSSSDVLPSRLEYQKGLWDDKLLAYCGRSRKLFECPAWNFSDMWPYSGDYSFWLGPSNLLSEWFGGCNFCYGYNRWGTGDLMGGAVCRGLGALEVRSDELGPARSVPDALVCHPSDMAAIGDYKLEIFESAEGALGPGDFLQCPGYNQQWWRLRFRHAARRNVIFCDGHIEPLGTIDCSLGDSDSQFMRRWNYDNQPHPETWKP